MLSEHEAIRASVQTSPEGPGKCLTTSLKISFFLHCISLNKMASASNFRTSLRRHNAIDMRNHFREQKHRQSDQSRPERFPLSRYANNSFLSLGIVKLKTMFKQHMNLMI